MGIFRKSASEPLAVTIAGVKLGARFLAIGVHDTKLIAALAAKAGLTGRSCAVDADAARISGAAQAIEREGALAEVVHAPGYALPFETGSFDVAVARDLLSAITPDAAVHVASEALRVLRGGGRLVVIESAKRARADALTAPLTTAGFAAVRILAEAEHTLFVEGVKRGVTGDNATTPQRPTPG